MNLEIIYHDAYYVAINKPSGLLVHRSPIDKHETAFAIQRLRDQIQQPVFPVHRLDKPTSGVLLFALSKEALIKAQALFQIDTETETETQKRLSKTYLAIVRGFAEKQRRIEHIVKAQEDKQHPDKRNQRLGITELRCLAQSEINIAVDRYPSSRYSLVELEPLTGRRHQLRYHMKHIAHPIIGDAKYGKSVHNHFFQRQFNSSRLLLAATGLSFIHPYTQDKLELHASVGATFQHVAEQLDLAHALPQASVYSTCA